MYANSRDIQTAQTGPHDKLAEIVLRHRDAAFRKPYAPWNVAAFDAAMQRWDGRAPILLDAGCGVGWSSLQLARAWPDHFVLGVDQSEDRLSRGKPGEHQFVGHAQEGLDVLLVAAVGAHHQQAGGAQAAKREEVGDDARAGAGLHRE
mgnify:CR=1 FL=1